MSEQIALDFEVARQHAARVGRVASDVRMAQDAANSLDLTNGAFGVMCSFLVPPAVLISRVAVSTISSVSTLLERAEDEFRGVVSDFVALEQDFVDRTQQLDRGLDGGVR